MPRKAVKRRATDLVLALELRATDVQESFKIGGCTEIIMQLSYGGDVAGIRCAVLSIGSLIIGLCIS